MMITICPVFPCFSFRVRCCYVAFFFAKHLREEQRVGKSRDAGERKKEGPQFWLCLRRAWFCHTPPKSLLLSLGRLLLLTAWMKKEIQMAKIK